MLALYLHAYTVTQTQHKWVRCWSTYWLILPISPCPVLSLDCGVPVCRKHFPSRINHIPASLILLHIIWNASYSSLQNTWKRCAPLCQVYVGGWRFFWFSGLTRLDKRMLCSQRQLRPLAHMMWLFGAPCLSLYTGVWRAFIYLYRVTWGKIVL